MWVVDVRREGANEREIGTQFHFYRGRRESKWTRARRAQHAAR